MGEPKLRGDLRIDEGAKNLGKGAADEHFRFGDGGLGQVELAHWWAGEHTCD
jgi:hypothetical protein